MSIHIGADYVIGIEEKRVYDTIIPISEEEYQEIVSSAVIPEKYFQFAAKFLADKHPEIDISDVRFSIRKDSSNMVCLNVGNDDVKGMVE